MRLVRLLAVSDEEEPQLLDERTVARLGPIDLVLGCGDLGAEYLDGLATRYRAPLLFVRGNHDPPRPEGDYPPEADLDGRVMELAGLRIAGLEGAHWYRGGPQQYREWQMTLKVLRLSLRLHRRPLDILLTHGPPAGVHEGTDLAHQGLRAVRRATERWRPRLLLHGHVHPYGSDSQRDTAIGATRVINVVGHRLLELEVT